MYRQGLHLFQGFQFGKVPRSRGCIVKLYTFFNSRDPQNLPLFEKFACSGQIIKKLKIARLEDSESKQKPKSLKSAAGITSGFSIQVIQYHCHQKVSLITEIQL